MKCKPHSNVLSCSSATQEIKKEKEKAKETPVARKPGGGGGGHVAEMANRLATEVKIGHGKKNTTGPAALPQANRQGTLSSEQSMGKIRY